MNLNLKKLIKILISLYPVATQDTQQHTTSGLAQWRQYPAETEVKIWKVLPRMKGSGSRHFAKPPGR
jgi:hypothetical protein